MKSQVPAGSTVYKRAKAQPFSQMCIIKSLLKRQWCLTPLAQYLAHDSDKSCFSVFVQ